MDEPLDRVGWTAPIVRADLEALGIAREARPADRRWRVVENSGRRTWLEADGWLVANGRLNVKYARVRSAGFDVATLMVYPTASPDRLPIFASEWVVVGAQCHVVVLDVESAADFPDLKADLKADFAELGSRWQAAFPPSPDAPAWFREIRREWALFSRCPATELERVRSAYTEYWRIAFERYYRPRWRDALAGPDHPAVSAYKQHHCEHSPGRRLLSAKFGADFAESFLRDQHFGPPPPPPPAERQSPVT